MITNVILDLDRKEPCTFRDWKCPVTFQMAGKTFRTEWSWLNDPGHGDLATITARIEHDILSALSTGNFNEATPVNQP